MIARLALLFVLVPLVELFVLIQLGRVVGLLPTVLVVLFTGALGAALARSQGLRTIAEAQREMAAGRLPGRALMDGLAILVGGALLLTPGLLTDLFGFLLLVPPTRRALQAQARRWWESRILDGSIQVGQIGVFGPGGWAQRPPPGSEGAGRPLDPRHEIRQEER
jgi:UPF0716 protein FxsA